MPQPKFIFGLETLLDMRKQVEKDKKLALAQVQQRIAAVQKQIQDAHAAITRQNRQLAQEKLVGRLDLSYISTEKRYVNSLHVLIAQCLQKLVEEERHLATARAALLAAARDRKVLEKLREKQHARWLAEQNRIESAQLDEIGTQLALRRLAESA